MLLVYALTRATTDGWGSPGTIALLAGSAAARLRLRRRRDPLPLAAAPAADLPARGRCRRRTGRWRSSARVTFSEFFLLTLYLQNVLALLGRAGRSGIRRLRRHGRGRRRTSRSRSSRASACSATLVAGLLMSALSVALLTRLPVARRLLLGSLPRVRARRRGLGLSFVPVTIASLVRRRRARTPASPPGS